MRWRSTGPTGSTSSHFSSRGKGLSDFHPLDRRAPPVARRRWGRGGAGAGEKFASTRSDLTATRDRAKRAHLWTASSGCLERIWTFGGTSEASNRRHPYSRGAEGDPSRPSLCRARSALPVSSVEHTPASRDFSRPTDLLDHNVARWGVDAGASLARGVGVGADASMPRVDVRFGGTPHACRARQAAATGDARARAVPGRARREPTQERR